jgi:aryl-alcohol dehydrogenase-like predicted oxidoreductase
LSGTSVATSFSDRTFRSTPESSLLEHPPGRRQSDRPDRRRDRLTSTGCRRFAPEARKANRAVLDRLGAIAERKKATRAQLALAWILAQKPWIVPIPGTTKPERLDENLGAASLELTPDDLREIERAVAEIGVQGARYNEEQERRAGR